MVVFRQVAVCLVLLVLAGCGSNDPAAPPSSGGSAPAVEVQSGDGDWQSFSLPTGGYSVELPGKGLKLPSNEGETSYGVELETGRGFVVMYSDVGEIKPEEIEARLTNVRNDMVGQQEVLHDATLTLDGRPVRDFAFVDAEGDALYYRITVAGTRLYQVMVVTEKSEFGETKADRERFLSSFKLLETK
jgi:predicted small lipoprotein YifL